VVPSAPPVPSGSAGHRLGGTKTSETNPLSSAGVSASADKDQVGRDAVDKGTADSRREAMRKAAEERNAPRKKR